MLCTVSLKLTLFLTVCVFGACFRTVAVNLVSVLPSPRKSQSRLRLHTTKMMGSLVPVHTYRHAALEKKRVKYMFLQAVVVVVVDHFYIVLFSALEQTDCARM